MTRTLPFSGKAHTAPPNRRDTSSADRIELDAAKGERRVSVSVSGELQSQRFREDPTRGVSEPLVSEGQASDLPWKPSDPGPLKAGDRFRGFRIVKEIGFGGYARVYHAIDELLDLDLAIKVIYRPGGSPQELAARSVAEARFLQSVYSPYVVRVYHAGLTEAKLFFIVMELLDGRSLRSILLKRPKLTWKMALPLFAKIAEGVQAAHEMNVIHRDLKPENIFVLRDGTPKVLDFGIAKFMDRPPITTRENLFHGTPPYMSPEQLSGRPVTARSDIYAFGIILYEVLAGKHPMLVDGGDNDPNSIAYRNIYLHPPLLNETDPSIYKPVARLVNRLIAKSPDLRPSSMTKVARELLACFERCQSANRGPFAVLSSDATAPDSMPEPPIPADPQPVSPFALTVQEARQPSPIGLTRAPPSEESPRRSAAPPPRVNGEGVGARPMAKTTRLPTIRWRPIAGDWLALALGAVLVASGIVALYVLIGGERGGRPSSPVASPANVPASIEAPRAAPRVALITATEASRGSAPTSQATASGPSPAASFWVPGRLATRTGRPSDKSDQFVEALETDLKRRQTKTTAVSADRRPLISGSSEPSRSTSDEQATDLESPFIKRRSP